MAGFFLKKGSRDSAGNAKPTSLFFLGFLVILFRLSFFGALLQLYGLFLLFR